MKLAQFKWMAIAMIGVAPAANAQLADLMEKLKACARTVDDVARMACYDDLGRQALAEEADDAEIDNAAATPVAEIPAADAPQVADIPAAAATVPVAAGAQVTDTESLPDILGGKDFEEESDTAEQGSRGLITSCKKGPDKRWYFFFDNGQAWKQVENRRLSFDDCNFYATVTQDVFGYKMQIDGEKRKIRISRSR